VTELTRGSVVDRPWGMTLGALGLRGLTGQVQLHGVDGKRYQIAFHGGAVVAAASPLASDAAVRIAMTGGLVSSSQVSDIARYQAANPQRDDIDVVAERVRLGADQAMRLRRRANAQRAARTFSVDQGEFIVEDRITLPLIPGAELDVRAVIFMGARGVLSEGRLAAELGMFGHWFRLRPEAVVDLPQFGFGEASAVLDVLEAGALLEDLERMGDPHVVRAMIYALASCNALESEGAQASSRPDRPTRPLVPQAQVPHHDPYAQQGHAQQGHAQPGHVQQGYAQQGYAQQAPPPDDPRQSPPQGHTRPSTDPRRPPTRAPLNVPPRPANLDPPTVRRTDQLGDRATLRRSSPLEVPTHRVASKQPRGRVNPADPRQAQEVQNLIKHHLQLLKKRVDHFTLLGTTPDASFDDVRKAYFALARQLHPDRLSALNIADDNKDAQRLFAQVNTAFSVLSDPRTRNDYLNVLRRGGEAAIAAEERRAEELAARIIEAEEAFRRGEAALRRDQLNSAISEFNRAVELNPDEVDYVALLAWAQFCASPDKMAISGTTRAALDRAIGKSPRSVTPRFLLGRVERMLGRDADALQHFNEVLQLSPHHSEAASEIRVIEQRMGGRRR